MPFFSAYIINVAEAGAAKTRQNKNKTDVHLRNSFILSPISL